MNIDSNYSDGNSINKSGNQTDRPDCGENDHILSCELADEIIKLARGSLFVDFRFMQRAISAIEIVPYEGVNNIVFACDGSRLYYDPVCILNRYREHQSSIEHAILHSLLHQVFHHSWVGSDINRELWSLAADIAVENTISDMGSANTGLPVETRQQALIKPLRDRLPLLNAENIYKYLIEHPVETADAETCEDSSADTDGAIAEKLIAAYDIFKFDQHSLWPSDSEDAEDDETIERMKLWRDISKRMQIELETMNSGQDLLCANLQSINRTRRSYAQFMRRFGNHGEVMRLSEDEFDNNYYAYGMELYGNIPLIEHLEYREQRHIREFVIAIDTSGSVQGETVQKFVQRTYDLIKSQETFDVRMKLHIIQCDDCIREDAVITRDDEFDRYISSMQILGLGKTDFRPVFEYVDTLLAERRLTNLAGLLYFTDGLGTFPTRKPPYDVAFIIHTDEVYPPEVPAWAMRLVLEDDFK